MLTMIAVTFICNFVFTCAAFYWIYDTRNELIRYQRLTNKAFTGFENPQLNSKYYERKLDEFMVLTKHDYFIILERLDRYQRDFNKLSERVNDGK